MKHTLMESLGAAITCKRLNIYLGQHKSMFISDLKNGLETNIFLQTSSPKTKTMLDKAAEFMAHTKDPSHGIDHINNLLKDTNRFFESTRHQFDMDQEVLWLA